MTPLGPTPASFDDFYRSELSRAVRRVALVVGSVPAAEDIVQDALIQIYRRWDQLEVPAAYLRTSTLHGALRWLSHQQREPAQAQLPDRASDGPPSFLELFDQLSDLSVRERAAVVFRYYDRMTEQEIADVLECRPGTVGPLLSRAREHLRKEWSGD